MKDCIHVEKPGKVSSRGMCARAIGENPVYLKEEVIVKDNAELLSLTEEIKAMEGVRDMVWSETVAWVGRKMSLYIQP